MRRLALLIAVLAVQAPAAQAACVHVPQRELAEQAEVIFTGVAESGPETPAVLRVEVWEKGAGPERVYVDTGYTGPGDGMVGEGTYPRPGERWRIFGEYLPDGGIDAYGTCGGSHRTYGAPAAPSLLADGAALPLARSTFAGFRTADPVPLRRLRRNRTYRLSFRAPAPVADEPEALWLARPRRGVTLAAAPDGESWDLTLGPAARRPVRLVFGGWDAFFAVRLEPVRP